VELFFLKVLRTLKPETTPRPAHIVPANHQTSVQVEKKYTIGKETLDISTCMIFTPPQRDNGVFKIPDPTTDLSSLFE
jgi:hypothetical protein